LNYLGVNNLGDACVENPVTGEQEMEDSSLNLEERNEK
jgi:hypothetical protein